MKKYLAALGLVIALSSPAFAEKMYYNSDITYHCNLCNPCTTGAAAPMIINKSCNTCNTYTTGAACPIVLPVNRCDTCLTGAACPVIKQECNTCAPVCCPQKRGFWSRFLRSGY